MMWCVDFYASWTNDVAVANAINCIIRDDHGKIEPRL